MCLANLVQGTVSKILSRQEVKPHKVRYYLEHRDEAFEQAKAIALAAAPSLEEGGVDLAVTRAGVRGEPVTVSLRYLASVRVPFVGWLFGDSGFFFQFGSTISARRMNRDGGRTPT